MTSDGPARRQADDALKKSLDSVSAGKKKTAKASVGKSDVKRRRKAS